jgi:transposase
MSNRTAYPSDLTDAQWALLAPLLVPPPSPAGRGAGRPREVDLREVVNAVLYVLREGCRWRAVPHDFPAWQTVYWYFGKWTEDGTLVRIQDTLRRRVREQADRDPEPSAVVIDSQSVKATEKGGTPATMPASTSRAPSGSSRSIPTGC